VASVQAVRILAAHTTPPTRYRLIILAKRHTLPLSPLSPFAPHTTPPTSYRLISLPKRHSLPLSPLSPYPGDFARLRVPLHTRKFMARCPVQQQYLARCKDVMMFLFLHPSCHRNCLPNKTTYSRDSLPNYTAQVHMMVSLSTPCSPPPLPWPSPRLDSGL
jgi:hypothetical protein